MNWDKMAMPGRGMTPTHRSPHDMPATVQNILFGSLTYSSLWPCEQVMLGKFSKGCKSEHK